MTRQGLRRRRLLAAAALLPCAAAHAQAGEVTWYTGAAGGRTDPFVSWAAEAFQARTGLHVRRVAGHPKADAAGVMHGPAAWGWQVCLGGPPRAARLFAAFLASDLARRHALELARRAGPTA